MIYLKSPYKHYKNNKIYVPIDYCKMQINDEWVDAILYVDEDKNKYVRPKKEFIEKFEINHK